jgi:hypothetical protein
MLRGHVASLLKCQNDSDLTQKELWRVQNCLKEMESLSSEPTFGDASTNAVVKLKTEVMALRWAFHSSVHQCIHS